MNQKIAKSMKLLWLFFMIFSIELKAQKEYTIIVPTEHNKTQEKSSTTNPNSLKALRLIEEIFKYTNL